MVRSGYVFCFRPYEEASVAKEEDAARAEVDRIMEEGLAALEKEQYDVAAERFRRVVQRAPFRQDARDYLAFIIQRQLNNAGSGGRVAPQRQSPLPTTGVAPSITPTRIRKRVSHLRFPMWLVATGIVLALVVIVVATTAPRFDFRGWVQNLNKPTPPPVNPAAEKLADELKRVDGAIQREQFDEALRILEGARQTALSLNPPDPKPVEDKVAQVWAARAEILISKQNYAKAIEAVQEGLKHNESLSQLNYLLGLCYFQQGLDAAARNDRAQSTALYQQAAPALEKAVQADPSHLRALDRLANCYRKINEPTKAVETWKRIIHQAPESHEAKVARDYLRSLGFKD